MYWAAGGKCRRHEAFLGGTGHPPEKNEVHGRILVAFRVLIWQYFIIIISYILCQKINMLPLPPPFFQKISLPIFFKIFKLPPPPSKPKKSHDFITNSCAICSRQVILVLSVVVSNFFLNHAFF